MLFQYSTTSSSSVHNLTTCRKGIDTKKLSKNKCTGQGFERFVCFSALVHIRCGTHHPHWERLQRAHGVCEVTVRGLPVGGDDYASSAAGAAQITLDGADALDYLGNVVAQGRLTCGRLLLEYLRCVVLC
jgi:hypothetical protein